MASLRLFIQKLREETGVPFPLAHHKPLLSGRELVLRAQEGANLEAEFCLVLPVENQLMLSCPGELFVERVVWEGDLAAGWRPHDLKSPVLVKPDVRFGRPAVSGVSTISIFEQAEDGASRQELAQDFNVTVGEVRWAIAYEEQRHAAA